MSFARVCVYAGSSPGRDPQFMESARVLGAALARRGIGVVYGGGRVGLMGALADAAMQAGGEVIGVIPDKLQGLELGHTGLTRLEVVPSMHARKLRMAELSDAFIALPGGFGTLEEVFEATTWTQLRYHEKPVGLLNVGGYWSGMIAFVDHVVASGFIAPSVRPILVDAPDVDGLLAKLEAVRVPELARWLDRP